MREPKDEKTSRVWRADAAARSFDTSAYKPEDRFDVWAEFISHSAEVLPVGDVDEPHFARLSAHGIGNIVVSSLDCAPQITRMRFGKQRQTDPETLHLRLYEGGRSSGVVGGETFVTGPGEIHAFDLGRPMTNITEGAKFVGAFIPYAAVGYDPSKHGPHGQISAVDGTGRLIASSMRTLVTTRTDLPEDMLEDVAKGFCALVSSLVLGQMGAPGAEREIERVRKSEVFAFVEANLADPDLTIERICRAFGASRATIYRDFSDVGGIRKYVQGRRLEHVRDELAHMEPKRGAITRVAERWGFTDQAHFTRAFRQAYDCRPGELIGSARDKA